jgi:hypothetical protein
MTAVILFAEAVLQAAMQISEKKAIQSSRPGHGASRRLLDSPLTRINSSIK